MGDKACQTDCVFSEDKRGIYMQEGKMEWKNEWPTICLWVMAGILTVLADWMAYDGKYSSEGCIITFAACVVYTLLCSTVPLPMMSLAAFALLQLANGLFYLFLIKEKLQRADIMAADLWLTFGSWLWLMGGVFSFSFGRYRLWKSRRTQK